MGTLERSDASVSEHALFARRTVPKSPGSVSFQLRAWTDRYEDWVQVRSDLSFAVDEALTRENITIA